MKQTSFSISYLNKINTVLKMILDIGIKYCIFERNFVKDIGNFKVQKSNVKRDEEKIRYITIDEFNKFIKVIDDEMWYTIQVMQQTYMHLFPDTQGTITNLLNKLNNQD